MVNVGDRVRFLNATGGGVVSKIVNRELVMVTDEDGFDIPTLAKECVVVETSTKVHTQEKKVEKPKVVETIDDFVQKEKEDKEYVPQAETEEGEILNVLLAFVPQNIKMLSTTDFDTYFVNDSNYYLAYNIATVAGTKFVSRAVGFIQPNTKIIIKESMKSELNEWENVRVQLFALKQDKPYSLKTVYDVKLKLNPVKFFKLHSFVENDYFDELAMIFPIVKNDVATNSVLVEEEIEKIAAKENGTIARKISKPNQRPEIIVKDFHINSLLDNTNGMSAYDMLQYQLKVFEETMQENLKQKGQKIVFIHGKGNGVLRKAILDELKKKYSTCYVRDASFQEYGYGASMVTIK